MCIAVHLIQILDDAHIDEYNEGAQYIVDSSMNQ